MNAKLKFVLAFNLILTPCLSFAGSEYLADILVKPITRAVSMSEMMTEFKAAQLISIGETHQTGVERETLRDIYQNLSLNLTNKPVCLAENFESLLSKGDIVRPAFESFCQTITDVSGNDQVTTGFKKYLEKSFGSRPVLTHSGFRHIMPMAQYFPLDFESTLVDSKPGNTISSQIPSKILSKTKMVSLSVLNFDDFPQYMLTHELTQLILKISKSKFVSLTQKRSFIAQNLNQINTQLSTSLQAVSSLIHANSDKFHYYKVAPMQSKSSPNRTAFLGLYTESAFNLTVLSTLLTSPKMVDFVMASNAGALYVRLMRSDTAFEDIPIGRSGILVFNKQATLITQPSGDIVYNPKPL